MYTLSYVLYGIGGVAVLILLGFTIALFKKKGTAKTNKIAIIISVLVAVASFGYGGYHQYDINQTIEAADDEFADNADKFTKLYKTTYDDIEESGNSIKDSWTKGIVEADITSIVEEALVDNQESIDNSTTNIHKLKKYLDTMNDYDTGEYDYDAYNKAYKRLNSLINYVSDPSGSLTSYSDKLDTLVSDVDDAYKDIE